MGTNETEPGHTRCGESVRHERPATGSGTTVPCTARIGASDLEGGTWIVVLRADTIPHVVMLQQGQCFSLEHDGNRRYPARKLWRLVQGKRIPSLFCELGSWARGPVAAAYEAHARIADDADCFQPVREYCAAWFPECAPCAFPYELVPRLARAGRLVRTAGMFLAESPGGRVSLPTYSRQDIRRRIAAVRAERRPRDA